MGILPILVWNGVGPGINSPNHGYIQTPFSKAPPPDGNFGIYALDCEICYTIYGLELIRVIVVASDGHLIYNSMVRPENYVIDYNTRFSGITALDLSKHATESLWDVQNDLLELINADTILVGHTLENEPCVPCIIHGTVIDTSVMFPHYCGLPYHH
jgi:RNA exonuclease 1